MLEKANTFIKENKDFVAKLFKPKYHLSTEIGWMNDPNGLVYYKNEYHVFYQFNPYDSVWGPMHWGHAKSKDLIHWEHLPVALAPDKPYDEGGCFSGSAIVVGDELLLMYTGVSEQDGIGRQVQCIAKSADGITFTKLAENPVIHESHIDGLGDTIDFRDPKIFKKEDIYYAIVASKTEIDDSPETVGRLYIFQSKDTIEWSKGSVLIEGNAELGNIWECPDFFELGDQDILILSPMNMPTNGYKFKNINSSIFLIGQMDWKTLSFTYSEVQEIDFGLDFYAPQTLLTQDNRRIMIAWMQSWGRTNVTDQLNLRWSGQMTLPRELKLEAGKIVQSNPSEIMDSLNTINEIPDSQSAEVNISVAEYININSAETIDDLTINLGLSKDYALKLRIDGKHLFFSREGFGFEIVGEDEHDNQRSFAVEDVHKIEIFIDKSSIEILVNGITQSNTFFVAPPLNKLFVESAGALVDIQLASFKNK